MPLGTANGVAVPSLWKALWKLEVECWASEVNLLIRLGFDQRITLPSQPNYSRTEPDGPSRHPQKEPKPECLGSTVYGRSGKHKHLSGLADLHPAHGQEGKCLGFDESSSC